MRLSMLAVLMLALAGCPPASSPSPTADAGPLDASPPSTGCYGACAVMSVLCQAQQPAACPATLARLEDGRLIRSPSGAPLTCACILAATSRPALNACGAGCGP